QGLVRGIVAMGMVVARHVADDLGALPRPAVGVQVQVVVHRVQDAPLHRLEAVAHVGQCPGGDDRQGVVQVTVSGFVGKWGRLDSFRHERTPPSNGCQYSKNCSKKGWSNPGQFTQKGNDARNELTRSYVQDCGMRVRIFVYKYSGKE